MMAAAQRIEQPGPGQLAGKQAGQAAIGAEQRGARMARAVPSLVAVGIGEDADPIALFQRVVQQPLEGTPIGMHLDRALDPRVVRHPDVGISAADVGEHDAILVLQRVEQLLGAVGVGREIALVVDQGV